MKILTTDDCYDAMFPKGVILWRPPEPFAAGVADDTPVREIVFKPVSATQFMARVSLTDQEAMWEPTVTNGNGIVVFVDSPPPPNWTHLIVTGTSRKMREPAKENTSLLGYSLFATVPLPVPDYGRFLHRMMELKINNCGAKFPDAVRLTDSVKLSVAGQRLVLMRSAAQGKPPPIYEYCLLK